MEVLVVSLRGVNFGFWSHLGCSAQNTIIFCREGLVLGWEAKKYKNIYLICICFICFIYSIHIIQVFDDNVFAIIKSHCFFSISLCFNMASFRGQKKSLGHAQIGLL